MKDQTFKLRLDAQDRERLNCLAAHYSAPAATALRILIKEKFDALWSPMALRDVYVREPPNRQIAEMLNRQGRILCDHDRDPCYLRCGVRRNQQGIWIPIPKDEREAAGRWAVRKKHRVPRDAAEEETWSGSRTSRGEGRKRPT